MKYEVPEINISKFSVENIVTESAVGVANDALQTALNEVTGDYTQTVRVTMNDWVE